jgi:small subunit ribosomal protein S6
VQIFICVIILPRCTATIKYSLLAVFRSWQTILRKGPGANARQSKSEERRYHNVRDYEVTIIIQPEVDDEPRAQLIERVSGWLTNGTDEAAKPVVHLWGQRRLAYPIEKHTDGHYVFFEARLDPTQMSEIERNLIYVEDILRHLIVRKEE